MLWFFGGSGFLGSHIADALSQKGDNVTIFDRTKSSWITQKQRFIEGDILNLTDIKKAINGQDIIYHMAGISDIDECHKNPLETVKVNILGTANILQECIKSKIEKFIFASSAYVYSEAGSFYRVSKQSCELLIESYQKKFGLDYVILRYGSLYGPRSNKQNSIYRILYQALNENKITYRGTGDEQREFIHVKDAAALSIKILNEEYKNTNIMLTGDRSIKYSDLLAMIQEIMHNKVEIEYIKEKSSTHYTISPYAFNPRLGKKLVSNPHIDLGQGIVNLATDIHKNIKTQHYQQYGQFAPEQT